MAKLNERQQKIVFTKIVEIYDLAQGVLNILEQPGTPNKEQQADMAIPVAEEMGASADIIVDKYMEFLEGNQTSSLQSTQAVEMAIRNVFSKAEELIEKISQESPPLR